MAMPLWVTRMTSCGHGVDSLAAPLLGPVGGGGGPLQIPGVAEGKDALLLLNKVLDVDLVLHLFNGGFPIVAVFIPNLDELGLEDLLHDGRITLIDV